MNTEYLITFDSKDQICTSVDKFKNLLNSLSSFSINKTSITFKEADFPYKIAKGSLTDSSIYYDLTITGSVEHIDKYANLLREVKKICYKNSNRNVIVLHDGIGEHYCSQAYPVIYKTENIMRKLISKFMAISIGYDWSDASVPKEVMESVRNSDGKREKTNFLQEVDFIQLSNFLFKKYSKADASKFIESIKIKQDDETIRAADIKQYSPFTNWEKYFQRKVDCDSEYLKSRWEKLYEIRCKIAHCKGLTKSDYDELITISSDVCSKIQTALDSVGDIHVEEEDREELAENLSGAANDYIADFISHYNKLTLFIHLMCDLSSSDTDVYNKHPTNKTNIRMQARYLQNFKGLISKEIADSIISSQDFRNKIVHKAGITPIDNGELISHTNQIKVVLENLYSIPTEELTSKKGTDLRSTESSE